MQAVVLKVVVLQLLLQLLWQVVVLMVRVLHLKM